MKHKNITKTMIKSIRKDLLQKQSELTENAIRVDLLDPSAQGSDEVDIAQTHILNDMMERLSQRDKDLLRKISRALTRIEEGTFGVCESCEESIGEKRIEAAPLATLCVGCAEDKEREAKQYWRS